MYDIIIIGAGTAGISAYKEAVKHTQNILIINDGPWDTTCARVGCMPSKILISSANRMHEMRQLDGLGLTAQTQIDTSQVMPHVQQLRNRFTRATLKDVDSWNLEHKLSGRAEFIDANTVQVNNRTYQAKNFILAVGTTPNIDEKLKEKLGDRLISTDEIFELEKLPESLAVIGSGVIAVELAQAMHRLGVTTHIFARSRKIGSLSSPALQQLAQDELSKELNIHFEVLPNGYRKTENGIALSYEQDGQEHHLNVDYVLSATGRKTLLNTLHLEQIDSSFNNLKNLPINPKTKQLSDYPIYIVGDAYTHTPIQHEAAHEGKYAAKNILEIGKAADLKTLAPLGIVFSSPEMATVGQSYKMLLDKKIEFVTGYIDYTKQGRAIVNAKNQGAVEVYVDIKTRRILGSELFCHEAEHLAHLLAWALDECLTIDDLLDKPYYHPTIEEGLRTALKHARRQL